MFSTTNSEHLKCLDNSPYPRTIYTLRGWGGHLPNSVFIDRFVCCLCCLITSSSGVRCCQRHPVCAKLPNCIVIQVERFYIFGHTETTFLHLATSSFEMGLLDSVINKDDVYLISTPFINSRATIRVKTVYNSMVASNISYETASPTG